MKIVPIPCLRDNYAYLVHREDAQECLVVDPSEAGPVRREIERRGLRLVGIACTHHHPDHVGGNAALWEPTVEVFGYVTDRSRIPRITRGLEDGEHLEVAGIELVALHVPGHTSGAVCYWAGEAAFTGDTLFCGGCGRLFEGSAEQMAHSLHVGLGVLPDETQIYTGHEYTQKNLEFALRVEPNNRRLRERLSDVSRRRQRGAFCASATMELERQTNPFLRCDSLEIRRTMGLVDAPPPEVFARLRSLKDRA